MKVNALEIVQSVSDLSKINARKVSEPIIFQKSFVIDYRFFVTVYRDDCALQCSSGTCFNVTSPIYCCNSECVGGCYGPSDYQCYVINFIDHFKSQSLDYRSIFSRAVNICGTKIDAWRNVHQKNSTIRKRQNMK